MLQLAVSEAEAERFRRMADRAVLPPEMLRWVEADEAAALAGVAVGRPGLWFPQGGWLDPSALCRELVLPSAPPSPARRRGAMAGEERILSMEDWTASRWPLACAGMTGGDGGVEVCLSTPVTRLERTDDGWTLLVENGRVADEVPVVVVANALSARRFAQTAWLPLTPRRGQTVRPRSTGAGRALGCVVTYGGYIAPAAGDGRHTVGATYDHLAPDADPLRQPLLAENAERVMADLEARLPGLGLRDEAAAGHAAVRATTPDRLPIVGPALDHPAFAEAFAGLRHGPRAPVAEAPPLHEGLYLHVGLGSRGVMTSPLTAELLAARLCGEPWPLEADLAEALDPSRFPVRALRKGKALV